MRQGLALLLLLLPGCPADLPPLSLTDAQLEAAGPSDDGGSPPTVDGAPAPTPDLTPKKCLETLPAATSPDPASAATLCNYMDWRLEADGFYYISQFWTEPGSGESGSTSCGVLRDFYLTYCCLYDRHSEKCLDGGTPDFQGCSASDPRLPKIPWATGTVKYAKSTLEGAVKSYFFASDGSLKPAAETMDFPHPEYFYVAGAQRFNCGSTLRVTNTENRRCIVVYAEDGGPGATYEYADKGKRRIIDASPALLAYLQPSKAGWLNSTLLLVEWGLPGDRPGQPCVPCLSTPAARGSEDHRSPFDLNHAVSLNCRVTVGP